MKRGRGFSMISLVVGVMVSIFVAAPVFAQSPHEHGGGGAGASPGGGDMMAGGMMPQMMQRMMPQMMQGMMQGMMRGMMQGMGPQMMQGMGPQMKAGAMGRGPWQMRGLRDGVNAWMMRLMARRGELGLMPKQVNELETVIAEHWKTVIRKRADVQTLKLDLWQSLRKKDVDPQAVETLMKKLADSSVELQMTGLRSYSRILRLLTETQRSRADALIGSPFPAPWERAAMGMGMKMGTAAPPSGRPSGTVPPQKKEKSGGHHGGSKAP